MTDNNQVGVRYQRANHYDQYTCDKDNYEDDDDDDDVIICYAVSYCANVS